MSTEMERYEVFVNLSARPASTWKEQLASRFPGEPESQAEVLALLADTMSVDNTGLLPPEIALAASACVTLLVRLSKQTPDAGKS